MPKLLANKIDTLTLTNPVVVAVAASRVVAALEADAAGDAARQLVELHVEAAAARVVVALAGHALVGGGRRGAAPRTVKVEACKFKEFIVLVDYGTT